MTTSIKAFEVGRTYGTRSICDYDCIFSFTVERRTAQTVWIADSSGKVKARRVRVVDGCEAIDPHGRYSMSPVLTASDKALALVE